MPEHDARTSVGLIDIATRLLGVLADVPVMARGAVTGLLAWPTSKTSIGKVFQDRAARFGDRVFLRFGDQQYLVGSARHGQGTHGGPAVQHIGRDGRLRGAAPSSRKYRRQQDEDNATT